MRQVSPTDMSFILKSAGFQPLSKAPIITWRSCSHLITLKERPELNVRTVTDQPLTPKICLAGENVQSRPGVFFVIHQPLQRADKRLSFNTLDGGEFTALKKKHPPALPPSPHLTSAICAFCHHLTCTVHADTPDAGKKESPEQIPQLRRSCGFPFTSRVRASSSSSSVFFVCPALFSRTRHISALTRGKKTQKKTPYGNVTHYKSV